ncbi:MAG TPA: DUF4292 domain-containing protein [Tenuifilaceae bacterium]|nr:DUF4292 domain-containing protein [Tenuifilaceae bacterium]HRX67215.1 DUF4292 domain-containing protein [Tenuifilaceae bacterium]
MLKNNVIPLLILIVFLVTCKSSDKIYNSTSTYNFAHHFDSLIESTYIDEYIENQKFNIRIDYKGTLHTLKSNMTVNTDSIIFIEFSSSFSIPIASFYAFPEKILVVDNPDRTVFESDYQTISEKLGFEVSFVLIQNVLLGKPYLITKNIHMNKNLNSNNPIISSYLFKDTIYNYTYTFNTVSKELQYFDIINDYSSKYSLSTNYSFDSNYSTNYPQKVITSFKLENNPIEIELDFRNLNIQESIQFQYDSTFKVLPLYPNNE